MSCLRAISSALPPDCTTPSLAQRLAKYGSTSTTFEPQPADISGLQLNAEMEAFVREFAAYQHDGWVHEKASAAADWGWCRWARILVGHFFYFEVIFGRLKKDAGIMGLNKSHVIAACLCCRAIARFTSVRNNMITRELHVHD